MARIGVRNLFIHELTEDTVDTVAYEESERVQDLIEVGITPSTDSAELYADDSMIESVTTLSSYDISIDLADISPEIQGKLLGQTVNEEGMVFSSADLNAPYFGISFKAERSDGTFEHRQMFKVRFAPADDNYTTKGDSVDFQTRSITGTAMPLKSNRLFDVRVVEDDTNADVVSQWSQKMFTDVTVAPAVYSAKAPETKKSNKK